MKNIMSFILGAVAGSIVTFIVSKKIMQTKFDTELEEEVSSYKQAKREYLNMVNKYNCNVDDCLVTNHDVEDNIDNKNRNSTVRRDELEEHAPKTEYVEYNKMYKNTVERIMEDDPRHPVGYVNKLCVIAPEEVGTYARLGYEISPFSYDYGTGKLITDEGESEDPYAYLGDIVDDCLDELEPGSTLHVKADLEHRVYVIEVVE